MPLTTSLQRGADTASSGTLTVSLKGSLDTATAPELEKKLGTALTADLSHVVFDLAELTFISSAGLRILSWTRKQLKAKDGRVSVVNAQPQIQAVFNVIKAMPGMGIFTSVAELDTYLAARQKAVLEGPV
jgi:anti-sigma B factor antagonist